MIVDHVFFFNLRSFDRLNKTPTITRQEEKSGVKYQDVQRAEAHEIMGQSLGRPSSSSSSDSGNEDLQRVIDQKRKFEAKREEAASTDPATSADSIAHDAMLSDTKVSDEPWEGDPEAEKENFLQEELYVHAKAGVRQFDSLSTLS